MNHYPDRFHSRNKDDELTGFRLCQLPWPECTCHYNPEAHTQRRSLGRSLSYIFAVPMSGHACGGAFWDHARADTVSSLIWRQELISLHPFAGRRELVHEPAVFGLHE